MWRVPSISPRSGRWLIAVLLAVKLVLLIWNAAAFEGKTYDADYHADRALFGGLQPSRVAHDGPVYYLPALFPERPDDVPRVLRATSGEEGERLEAPAAKPPRATRAEKRFRAGLLDVLRATNVLWIATFYGSWLYVLFPRLLPGFSAWFLASLLLLALPGYQRLAVMSHPDNLAVALASVGLAVWIVLRERWRRVVDQGGQPPPGAAEAPTGIPFGALVVLALLIGLLAATRNFATVPALVLSVVCALYLARSLGGDWRRLAPRLALLVAVISALGLSWHVYSREAGEGPPNSGLTSYVPSLAGDRAGFDYLHYYGSFEPRALLRDDRQVSERLSNSFFSLLYAEVWGDRWLGFSTAKSKDVKRWPRRALLGSALAVPLIVLLLAIRSIQSLVVRARSKAREFADHSPWRRWSAIASELEPELVLGAIVVLGSATFLGWQGGPALLPGDNSTVKFTYVAALFPPAIALLFSRSLAPATSSLLSGYFLVLYLLAFPVAMYWPS